MKKNNIQIILLLLVLIAVSWFFFGPSRGNKNQPSNAGGLQTQENSEGAVSIKITPSSELKASENQWKFDIIMDTHSVELVDDMTKVAFLVDDKGGVYQPISWQGDPPGGHHREGVFIFNSIAPRPDSITLQIKNVGDVASRDFSWKLE